MVERRNTIRDYILKQGEVTIEELLTLFPERSAMTIRRDLDYLEEQNYIIRTHGGAKANIIAHLITEDYYADRLSSHLAEKEEIAATALLLFQEQRAVYIDSGTTAMKLAQILPDKYYTIITADPNIAIELASKRKLPAVTLLGGQLSTKTLSISGAMTSELLDNINIDTAFMCTSGFSLSAGFTSGNSQESMLKRQVIKKARKIVMLMDSSKIGKDMPHTFARLEDIHILISDQLPEDIYAACEELQIELL